MLLWTGGESGRIMLKLCGGIFIVLSTTLMGMRRADDVREQYRQMEYIRRMLCTMESGMRYEGAHLGEIFSGIAGHAQSPYREWMLAMCRDIKEHSFRMFGDIWSEGIDSHLTGCRLPPGEIERLKSLGDKLGTADVTLQLKILEMYQEQLAGSMEEAREEMRPRVRLCHCMGIMSGMLIAVLLL